MPEINEAYEVRTVPLTEIRMVEDDEFSIQGVAAVYEKWTDMGWYEEKIERGFFTGRLNDDVRSCFNHDLNLVLGRNKSGTLRIEDRDDGLHFAVKPPNTSYANDLLVSLKRGDVDGCSFMFRTQKDEWDETDENNPKRILKECKELFELGPVTIPAYPQTSVVARMSRAAAMIERIKSGELPTDETQVRSMIESLEAFLQEGQSDSADGQAADGEEGVIEEAQAGLDQLRAYKLKIMKLR